MFKNEVAEFIYKRTYSRWIEEENRREDWPETIERFIGFIKEERPDIPEKTENSEPAWFGFPITIKDNAPFTLVELNAYLSSHNVDTRPIFSGNITRQPYFKTKNYNVSGSLENSDKIMMQTFWIGVYPGLTTEMMEYVVNTIENFINHKIN